jgi:hypothetical protein
MSFGYPDIEKPLGECFREKAGAGSTRHRAGYRHDLRILARDLGQPLSKRSRVR